MDEHMTIHLFLKPAADEQVNDLKNRLKKYNIISGPSIEDNTVWILTGNKADLKKALIEVFYVWNGICPILPEELMSEEDANKFDWNEK